MLNEYLADPAVQSGVLPFIVAGIWALLLRRFGWVWAGFGFIFGFAVLIHLTVGWQFEPLTSTRKFIIAVFGAAALGLVLDIFLRRAGVLNYFLGLVGAALALWFVYTVLQRQEGAAWNIMAAGVAAYAAWMIGWTSHLNERDTLPSLAAMVALGGGTGAVAMLGATALYAQIGFALAASCGALALVALFTPRLDCGRILFLAAGVAAALAGIACVIYAKVPWYGLLPLLVVPVLGHLPKPVTWPRWIHAGVVFILCALCASSAAYLVYRLEGAPSL